LDLAVKLPRMMGLHLVHVAPAPHCHILSDWIW